jgi:peptidoglycan/LPS O-acetylase OafA/YrhL
VQLLCISALAAFFILYMKTPVGDALTILPLGLLFGWLIVNVSSNPVRLFSLEHSVTDYLGKISYGIYMYHMPVVYAAGFLCGKTGFDSRPGWIFFPTYFLFVFLVTIVVASVSYHLIEQPLLKRTRHISVKPVLQPSL